jgi:hypothetical protein
MFKKIVLYIATKLKNTIGLTLTDTGTTNTNGPVSGIPGTLDPGIIVPGTLDPGIIVPGALDPGIIVPGPGVLDLVAFESNAREQDNQSDHLDTFDQMDAHELTDSEIDYMIKIMSGSLPDTLGYRNASPGTDQS